MSTHATAEQTVDVLVIGAGPIGLTLANILGMAGVRVLVAEQRETLIDYPRAIGLDDEALRSFQAIGLAEKVLPHTTPHHWMRFTTSDGQVFASIEPRTDEFGWSRRNAFIQPLVDEVLYQGLARFDTVSVLFGHGLESFEQDAGGIIAKLGAPGGGSRTVRARWMVGADGGNSLVRRTLKVPFEGRTAPNQWCVIDVRNDPLGTPHVYLHCDPERPHVSAALPHGIRRFEFLVMPGESQEDFERPEVMRKLLSKVVPDPDRVDIIRRRVYTHNARLAERFRIGRVLLAGDAAHIMPVWQGQGYNTGIRDATNLGWKLAMVVQGRADDKLLDTYELERRDHARAMIHLSEVAGDLFAPDNPKVGEWRDTIALALNAVPQVKRYFVEMRFKPMPRYKEGAIVPEETPARPRAGRELALMGKVMALLGDEGSTPLARLLSLMRENEASLPGRLLKLVETQPEAVMKLVSGLFAGSQSTAVGKLFIQPKVRTAEGEEKLLDDVIGANFAVLAWGTDPTYGMNAATRAFWEALGARFITLKPVTQMNYEGWQLDPEVTVLGDPSGRVKEWFGEQPKSIVFLRPDRFVAALASPQDIDRQTRAFAEALAVAMPELQSKPAAAGEAQ